MTEKLTISSSSDLNTASQTNIKSSNICLSRETVMRLLKDVKEIIKSPLTSHGIYYHHNESDMLKGKALIIGPKGTPYENGFYLFDFIFPINYPHSPPKVTFCTHDGVTRFNPNLYINGNVCLSILNTWNGEQWTGCQTISSVLLALCTILNDSPLLNEPGITKNHRDYNNYNTIIEYKNISIAIHSILSKQYASEKFPEFIDIMKNSFINNYDTIIEKINKNIEIMNSGTIEIKTALYDMSFNINYNKLKNIINTLKTSITDN